jgi:hypothetical protein
MDRLDGATVESGLAPIVDAMEPGDRLLLVLPAGKPSDRDTEWITAFRRLGRQWQQTLGRDERLSRVAEYRPEDLIGTPYSGTVFERR